MLRSAENSFVGSHTNRIDGKGRVAAPADFRRALDLARFNGFFCIPSLEGPFLECGGPDYIEWLKRMIAPLPPFDPRRRAIQRQVIGAARPISFDADGRFILPEPMRAHASLEGEAYFIGVGDTFQIWRPDRAAAQNEELADIALEALLSLGAPGSSSAEGGA